MTARPNGTASSIGVPGSIALAKARARRRIRRECGLLTIAGERLRWPGEFLLAGGALFWLVWRQPQQGLGGIARHLYIRAARATSIAQALLRAHHRYWSPPNPISAGASHSDIGRALRHDSPAAIVIMPDVPAFAFGSGICLTALPAAFFAHHPSAGSEYRASCRSCGAPHRRVRIPSPDGSWASTTPSVEFLSGEGSGHW